MLPTTLTHIAKQFLGNQIQINVAPLGKGLINTTLLITDVDNGKQFVLQKINTNVFKNPDVIAQNIQIIEGYLSSNKIDYLFLTFLRTKSGELFYVDEMHNYWRMYEYVSDSCTVDIITDEELAKQTAFQFARFSQIMQGIDFTKIRPSIPDFHNLAFRYHQFEESTLKASVDRLHAASEYTSFLKQRHHYVEQYLMIISDPQCPLRMVHADAKIANILFRKKDLSPFCVIDFDTLMPGYFFSDLGDMIRTMVCSHDENEPDCDKLQFRRSYYDSIVEGYCAAIQLTEKELSLIEFAGLCMTYMQALRFTTDYLNGDIYYAISYKEHNFDRLKNQCKLLDLLEKNISSTNLKNFKPLI